MFGSMAVSADDNFTDVSKLAELMQQDHAKLGYDQYMQAFIQYNNSLHLDSQGGCSAIAKTPVTLYIVIVDSYVSYITPIVDDEKARCFRKLYLGLRVKAPPFSPFVIEMQFAGASPSSAAPASHSDTDGH
jgi:hypothetical protein